MPRREFNISKVCESNSIEDAQHLHLVPVFVTFVECHFPVWSDPSCSQPMTQDCMTLVPQLPQTQLVNLVFCFFGLLLCWITGTSAKFYFLVAHILLSYAIMTPACCCVRVRQERAVHRNLGATPHPLPIVLYPLLILMLAYLITITHNQIIDNIIFIIDDTWQQFRLSHKTRDNWRSLLEMLLQC